MAIIPYLKFTYVCIKCSICNQLIELDNTVIYENGKPIICDECKCCELTIPHPDIVL